MLAMCAPFFQKASRALQAKHNKLLAEFSTLEHRNPHELLAAMEALSQVCMLVCVPLLPPFTGKTHVNMSMEQENDVVTSDQEQPSGRSESSILKLNMVRLLAYRAHRVCTQLATSPLAC